MISTTTFANLMSMIAAKSKPSQSSLPVFTPSTVADKSTPSQSSALVFTPSSSAAKSMSSQNSTKFPPKPILTLTPGASLVKMSTVNKIPLGIRVTLTPSKPSYSSSSVFTPSSSAAKLRPSQSSSPVFTPSSSPTTADTSKSGYSSPPAFTSTSGISLTEPSTDPVT